MRSIRSAAAEVLRILLVRKEGERLDVKEKLAAAVLRIEGEPVAEVQKLLDAREEDGSPVLLYAHNEVGKDGEPAIIMTLIPVEVGMDILARRHVEEQGEALSVVALEPGLVLELAARVLVDSKTAADLTSGILAGSLTFKGSSSLSEGLAGEVMMETVKH